VHRVQKPGAAGWAVSVNLGNRPYSEAGERGLAYPLETQRNGIRRAYFEVVVFCNGRDLGLQGSAYLRAPIMENGTGHEDAKDTDCMGRERRQGRWWVSWDRGMSLAESLPQRFQRWTFFTVKGHCPSLGKDVMRH